jgi:hypothetical protein
VTNRDWKEIENQLHGLVPNVSQNEKPLTPAVRIRRPIQADEEALLAHIAEALTQEKNR